MTSSGRASDSVRNDLLVLLACSAMVLFTHFLVGNQYGFHRDELQFLDDARHLAWGYVAYPPVTAFMGRLAIAVFGISVAAFRLPATLAAMTSLILTGLIARDLGGRRPAQLLALATAMASQVILGSLMLYVVWDFLAWTLVCWSLTRLLRTDDQRWWLAVGAAVGFGILCKYSIAFLVISLLLGLIALPSQRRHLRSPWFYAGLALALLIAAPNLVWEARHDWVSLKMLSTIHARDIRLGRADGYLTDQLKYSGAGLILAAFGLAGLVKSPRFRLLIFFFAGPLVLFFLAKGRGYYLLPAYTPVYAAGAVWVEDWLRTKSRGTRVGVRAGMYTVAFAGVCAICVMMLPIARRGSALFRFQMRTSSDMRDETGWQSLVQQVAKVRDTLPPQDRERLAVVTGNYGEAGALALYGPQYGLPVPISTVNSFFYRGFGPYEPQTVLVVGERLSEVQPLFESCTVATYLTTEHGYEGFDAEDGPVILCRGLRGSWPEVWRTHQHYG